MIDDEMRALAQKAGFSKTRTVWHSHKIHVDTLQPANYRELKAFYDLAFELGRQEERRSIMVKVSGVPYEVDLPKPDARDEFEKWWFEMEGFGMRCERPQTQTEAAWMAWQHLQTQLDDVQSKLKHVQDQLEWLVSIGK